MSASVFVWGGPGFGVWSSQDIISSELRVWLLELRKMAVLLKRATTTRKMESHSGGYGRCMVVFNN